MFDRSKINFLDRWWFSIDKKIFFFYIFFSIFGLISLLSASIPVANRIGNNGYFLFLKQLRFVIPSVLIFIFISFFDLKIAKTTIVIYFFLSFVMLSLVPLFGYGVKGSKRWLSLKIITIQPMEFVKSSFILFHSLILSEYLKQRKKNNYLSTKITKEKAEQYLACDDYAKIIEELGVLKKDLICYVKQKNSTKPLYTTYIILMLILYLLYKQPDIGNMLLLLLVVMYQLFLLDSVKKRIVFSFVSIFSLFLVVSYFSFSHVKNRINNYFESFLNVDKAQYQVKRSILGYRNSNFFGNGFLEGEVKNYIPDAHTDFIFPVVSEEFGFICIFIVLFLYFFIAIRLLYKSMEYEDIFLFFALNGLSILFIFQSMINIGVSLNLLPTKGMTLPFFSYGGSSLLANSINFGYLLVFTKRTLLTVRNNFDELLIDTEKL